MPFDRNADGTIYQRPFGGHSANFGENRYSVLRRCRSYRPCHVAHVISAQCTRRAQFFVEWMALDLIRDTEGDVLGVTALEMETGEVMILQAKTTLFATGGAGRIWGASTNAFINTGDGLGMAARAGIPLEDMSSGSSIDWRRRRRVLITKACAARAVSCSTPTVSGSWSATPQLKTSPRATSCRARWTRRSRKAAVADRTRTTCCSSSITSGRNHHKRLPSIREIAIKFANVDPIKDPIPVFRRSTTRWWHPDQYSRPGRGAEGWRPQHRR